MRRKYEIIFCALFLFFTAGCNNAENVRDENVAVVSDSSAGGNVPPRPSGENSANAHGADTGFVKVQPIKTASADTALIRHEITDTSGIRNIVIADSITKIQKPGPDTIPVINIAALNNDGIVMWQMPETMKTLEQSLVQVRVATHVNEQTAKNGMDTIKKSYGSAQIEVTEKMKVNLVAGNEGDFIIVAKDSIHTIPSKKYAEWFWAVTPLQAGTRYLILKVSQVKIVNGKEMVLEENSVLSKEFKVKVSASFVFGRIWDFIKNNWAIITAIITFFAGLFVRKKIKEAQKLNP